MKKPTLRDRISYQFDNIMSKGAVSLIVLLFLITFVVVIIVGAAAFAVDPKQTGSISGSMWASLMHILDTGNLAGDNTAANKFFPLLMTVATICGLFVTSILIGIINTTFETKLESLRKGNSRVLEQGHTIILGYDDHIYAILSELIVANENAKKPCIVVLAEDDKEVMVDNIHTRIPDTKNTRIICRSGKPSSAADLENVSIYQCKNIIVAAFDDMKTIKTILAVANILDGAHNPSGAHITAIINSEENLEAARIAGGQYLEVLHFENAISRIIAQTCRQSGLSEVYQELFDFDGDEIYIEHFPKLAGKQFGDLPFFFENASVLGMKRGEEIVINPAAGTEINGQDEIILIASDDGAATPLAQMSTWDSKAIQSAKNDGQAQSEKLLILGYNRLAVRVLTEIDNYMSPGSKVMIACEQEEVSADFNAPTFKNFDLTINVNNIYNRAILEAQVDQDFDYIVVLSDLVMDAEGSDSKTLMLLLQLRDIAKKHNRDFTIVSEMRDSENQKLASCIRINDFVIGSNLVSIMMTQVSENRRLKAVFDVLLSDEGSEIYMKPALDYVHEGVDVDLYTVTKAALQHNELLIGYKKRDGNGRYKIIVNPPKSEKVRFTKDDSLVVLAED